MGLSLFLHGLVIFLFFIVWAKRPEPGGSGLVMDAFLVNGGDGFYQPGVPWGDFGAVPGKKGSPGAGAEETALAEKSVSAVQERKNSDTGMPGKEPAAEAADEKIQAGKPSEKQEIFENKEHAAVLPAVRKKTVAGKPAVKKTAVHKNKASGPARVKKESPAAAGGSETEGDGGTGTPAYGGAVGDAPGFGAGRGRGIGIGSGAGVGDVRAARYFVRLRRIFQRRLKYPEELGTQKISGKAVVRFSLDADGKLEPGSVILAESSGNDVLDARALKTIREVPSLPAPPYGAMVIEIPVIFRVYH